MGELRQGTAIGAVAHDGQNLYVYFVVTDDTMHFDSVKSDTLWMYDAVELWLARVRSNATLAAGA